jgi:hypothetical protein
VTLTRSADSVFPYLGRDHSHSIPFDISTEISVLQTVAHDDALYVQVNKYNVHNFVSIRKFNTSLTQATGKCFTGMFQWIAYSVFFNTKTA